MLLKSFARDYIFNYKSNNSFFLAIYEIFNRVVSESVYTTITKVMIAMESAQLMSWKTRQNII